MGGSYYSREKYFEVFLLIGHELANFLNFYVNKLYLSLLINQDFSSSLHLLKFYTGFDSKFPDLLKSITSCTMPQRE